ncbi:MAG: VTT domain-containing protein [Bacteroidota bacterium]|uniref:YqaA family protein n=1 Tax=Parabacteroides sp. FAFU027 TaxID=2922715 RepID=UPI001FAF33E6|nr:VTT domain-containing protein [Parabacteroides sp. FAFU027]MDP4270184.1 VTT domain-containing protein [Bacteroidota bacterium]
MEFILNFAEWGYFGLFLASFLAATILPFSSEIVFSALVLAGMNLWGCTVAATIGNFLGGLSCYYLGYLGNVEWIEKYLKIKKEKVDKLQNWLNGKGSAMAFFVFLPGVGDIIAVALGFLRANVYAVSLFMFAGKFIRYIVWMQMVYGVIKLF